MKTPRTDRNERIVLGGVGGDWKVVLSAFARQLETELAAMTALADRLAEALGTCRFKDWFKTQETGQISVILNAGKVREALAAYENHKKQTP